MVDKNLKKNDGAEKKEVKMVQVKFLKPQPVGDVSYREGEKAGFSKAVADRIVKAGSGEIVK